MSQKRKVWKGLKLGQKKKLVAEKGRKYGPKASILSPEETLHELQTLYLLFNDTTAVSPILDMSV